MALSAAFKRVLFIAAVALAAVADVQATQVMRRPAAYKDAPNNATQSVHARATSGKVNAAYFTNWYGVPVSGISVPVLC